METNVDTYTPGTCTQLTHCLIKVIYWLIYEGLIVTVKQVHAALTLQSEPLLYFYLDFNCNNVLKHPLPHYQTNCVSILHRWRREIDTHDFGDFYFRLISLSAQNTPAAAVRD